MDELKIKAGQAECSMKVIYEDETIAIIAPVGLGLGLVTLSLKRENVGITLPPGQFLELGKSFVRFMQSEGVADIKAIRSFKDWVISKV